MSLQAKNIVSALLTCSLIVLFFTAYLRVYMFDLLYYVTALGLCLLATIPAFLTHGIRSSYSWAAYFKNLMGISILLLLFCGAYTAGNMDDSGKALAFVVNSSIYFGFFFSVGLIVTLSNSGQYQPDMPMTQHTKTNFSEY